MNPQILKTIDSEGSNNGLTAEQLEAAVLVTLFKGEELNHLLYINNGYSRCHTTV